MKGIEEISKMNLADIDAPESAQSDQDDLQVVSEGEVLEGEVVEKDSDNAGTDEEVPVPEPEKMDAPTGEHYTLDVKIGRPELAEFVKYHMFHSISVLGVIAMGIILPIYSWFLQRDKMYMSVAFFVVLVIVFPIWQYKKVVDENLKNPIYQNVFHYMFDEKGFHLEAGLRAINVEWKHFTKVKEVKGSYILYTGKANAYIIPKKDLGASEAQIMGFIKRMIGL